MSGVRIPLLRPLIISNGDGGRSSVGRAMDCDSIGRGFEPHRPPHYRIVGSLAQLVEQLTFNQLVTGSNPVRPTNYVLKLHVSPISDSIP